MLIYVFLLILFHNSFVVSVVPGTAWMTLTTHHWQTTLWEHLQYAVQDPIWNCVCLVITPSEIHIIEEKLL
jgi:hypothetical protein